MSQWKKYPDSKLVGKYIGHQVHFFTMPAAELEQSEKFVGILQRKGFSAELKKAKDNKPSVVVDLTDSKIYLSK